MDGNFIMQRSNALCYYSIPAFENTGLVKHGFSTRSGGVSTGECTSLNLGFKRKDKKENVIHNFNTFCDAIGISSDQTVFTDQVHGDKLAIVGKQDKGKGFQRISNILEIDGLVTNQPGVALVTFYADCVPLFFLDPVHKAIGLSHSGWQGTVEKIAAKTLALMGDQYGTHPMDCLVGIGPSIGQCCFEVDEPVAARFAEAYPNDNDTLIEVKGPKYHIDLWRANRIQLESAGVKLTNITTAQLCTCCKKDVFFSHRGHAGKTGSMAAVMMLIE